MYTVKEVKRILEHRNFEILDFYYRKIGKSSPRNVLYLKCKCNEDSYIWDSSFDNLKNGSGCPKCSGNVRITDEFVYNYVGEICDIELLNIYYKNKERMIKLKCNLDNHIWDTRFNDFKKGSRCPMCAGNIKLTKDKVINYLKDRPFVVLDVYDKKPNENSESKVYVKCKCNIDGRVWDRQFQSLKISGCPSCSSRMSLPERFCFNLLKELDLKFETEKVFDWAYRKRYDFYIPSLNMIIETHGAQHYKEVYWRKLDEQNQVDKYKKSIAMENGILYYEEIDCRNSTEKWLTDNMTRSLSKYFNLNHIDFKKIYKDSLERRMVELESGGD